VRLLLDTHVILWRASGERMLGQSARAAIQRAAELTFSVVSFAEIGEEVSAGKLTVPKDLYQHILGGGVRILGLAPDHGLAVASLPLHHRDPFDRLLIAQARQEGLTILTGDKRFSSYDVDVIDASGELTGRRTAIRTSAALVVTAGANVAAAGTAWFQDSRIPPKDAERRGEGIEPSKPGAARPCQF
jgi:PIN domain nuclease of toxin-antitoxin system